MDPEAVVVAQMRLSVLFLVFAAACEPEVEPVESAEPYVAPLAPPWFAITASTFDGAFRSTCVMNGSLVDTNGVELAAVTLSPADGGLWTGKAIEAGVQTKLTLTWTDCVNNDNGTGTFTSNTFSGGDGDLFVIHYSGSTTDFEWMVQGTDHLGGEVHAQFSADASPADVDALVEGLGLTSSDDRDDPTFRYLSWTTDTSVIEALDDLRASELFLWGEPTWVAKPSWW